MPIFPDQQRLQFSDLAPPPDKARQRSRQVVLRRSGQGRGGMPRFAGHLPSALRPLFSAFRPLLSALDRKLPGDDVAVEAAGLRAGLGIEIAFEGGAEGLILANRLGALAERGV